MKDSGVEWLGEVPAHWDCSAIKRYCSLIKDGTHLPPPRVSDGVPLLSVRNIVDGEFVKRSDDSNISQKDYIDLCRSFIPQKGDVLLAIVGATLGKTAIICNDVGKFHIQRSLALFRVIPAEMTPEWLHWVVRSTGFRSLLWEYAGFSAQPGIYLGTLASFSIPVPPVEEQIKIGEEIHCKIAPMTTLIYEAKKAVTLIKERRSALISAAVTGKIDVRGWKPPEDESAFAESGTENIEATV
jgi:type I restriction enzyme S subunit